MNLPAADVYPRSGKERDAWIVQRRGPKHALDPRRPYAYLWEEEPGADSARVPTATIFLTNRECPFRCLMCDLWRDTLDERVPPGAIPAQIEYALERLPPARQVKLYNAGNFFDPQAIPPEDYGAIARIVSGFGRVIVESHPTLLGRRCLRLRDLLPGTLEVAVGLETVHPDVLQRLNKRLTVDAFRRASDWLAAHSIDLRVFLLQPAPFLDETEGLDWTKRSLDVAFGACATACSIIPTRTGNGALDELAEAGAIVQPSLRSLEAAQEYGLSLGKGRVFVDLWDIERFYACTCSPARAGRLRAMNQTQQVAPLVSCPKCGAEV